MVFTQEQRLFFIEAINNILLRKADAPILTGGMDDNVPTEADKPSPKSSLTKTNLRSKLYEAFPYNKEFKISSIANTNSMEPLLDDSDLVVLERLDGSMREKRLTDQPFAKGQIVVYPSSVGNIIHTLKEKTTFLGEPAWIIQGNNNFLPDMAKVPERLIKSRLVAIGYGRQVREDD